ncbi:MAG: hypothetical protein PHI29_10980 [Gallionella sp.]|nr:hypothetical protein [Gallionella sp.]
MKIKVRRNIKQVNGKIRGIAASLFSRGLDDTLEYFCALSVFSSVTIL